MRSLAKVCVRIVCPVIFILVPDVFVPLTMRCGGAGQILRALNRNREAVEAERRVLELLQSDKGASMDGSVYACVSSCCLPHRANEQLMRQASRRR